MHRRKIRLLGDRFRQPHRRLTDRVQFVPEGKGRRPDLLNAGKIVKPAEDRPPGVLTKKEGSVKCGIILSRKAHPSVCRLNKRFPRLFIGISVRKIRFGKIQPKIGKTGEKLLLRQMVTGQTGTVVRNLPQFSSADKGKLPVSEPNEFPNRPGDNAGIIH